MKLLSAFRKTMSTTGRAALLLSSAGLLLAPAPAKAAVILQYFESKWETIERKLPDVFVAGYTHLWVPPPGKGDTGGFTVGYDVYDRFNLGTAFDQTLYGTEASAKTMVNQARRASIGIYFDYVPNHNGFRNNATPGFAAGGGYPGFVLSAPGDADGDFHGAFESGLFNSRLAGLLDIAQEKNYVYIRQPVAPNAQNIPLQAVNPLNARFYPDRQLTPNGQGIYPFNLANPMAGDATPENATGLLMRNAQWLIEVMGADGLRLDAVRHIPTWFFNNFFDVTMYQRGRPNLLNQPTTPFSFGEAYTGDAAELSGYIRKDGFGNRDVKDFPLFFVMRDVLNAGGFGDISRFQSASIDGSDGNANDGSRGVLFAQSHDDFGPAYDNVAYAYILSRAGFPIVYFNAREFGNGRDFPKNGRGDALGGDFGTVLTRLVDINRRFAKGAYISRHVDTDTLVYERDRSLIVGLNDRADSGYDTRTFPTGFTSGQQLMELTGNATDPFVDPANDIFDTVTVGAGGTVTIRVPRNKSGSNDHRRGYVMYGLASPTQVVTVTPTTSTLPADPISVPNALRRFTALPVVTANTFTVQVQTTGTVQEDNAVIRLNGGLDINSTPGIDILSGELAGYEQFTTLRSPRDPSGTGTYQQAINATVLPEGLQFIETNAFIKRPADTPPVYSAARNVIYLDRLPPPAALRFPSQTGTSDVVTQSYTVVVNCPDATADSMHIFFDQPDGFDFYGNVTGANKMTRTDRDEFRFAWNNITNGMHHIHVVAFEPTGNRSVTKFSNIGAVVSQPAMELGVDTNPSAFATSFAPTPGTINVRAYANDFVVRVDKGPGRVFPADYNVSLEIDGVNYPAQSYDIGLLPPVNRLVQNDQELSDNFDEFRLVWRGYGVGPHSLIARANLTTGTAPSNSAAALITVDTNTSGPSIVINSPAPAATLVTPTSVTLDVSTDFSARSLLGYIELGQTQQLIATINNPPSPVNQILSSVVSNYLATDDLAGFDLQNGVYNLRAVAATGLNGSGISSSALTTVSVTGFPNATTVPVPVVDGNVAEYISSGIPALAVSAADGGSGGANPADFGSDGSLTEFHARVNDGNLYLTVRGDMFNGANPNQNATIIYIDCDSTSGTGIRRMVNAGDSQLNDTSGAKQTIVSRSGFSINTPLQTSGVGFDAAVIVNGRSPLDSAVYGFGTGGTAGTSVSLALLNNTLAFGTAQGGTPGTTGTVINAPTAFEVRIPLSELGNPNPRNMAFSVVTTSDAGFPSPNTLPENASNAFDPAQVIDGVARFPSAPNVLINEFTNGPNDWMEFVNLTTGTVNLNTWSVQWTDAAGIKGVLPLTGLSVPAGAYRIASERTPNPATGIVFGSNIPWNPIRGGALALLDSYGIAVDFVRWNALDGTSFPNTEALGTSFNGFALGFQGMPAPSKTLGRNAASTDTNNASDWSVQNSTAGAQNIVSGVDESEWRQH